MEMEHNKTKNNRTTENPNSYDVPIPKPPSELLDSFLTNLQGKLVTRRFTNSRTTNRQHHRPRGGSRSGSQ